MNGVPSTSGCIHSFEMSGAPRWANTTGIAK